MAIRANPAYNDNGTKPLMVTDDGIVLLLQGPHRDLTKVMKKLLAKSKDNQRREDFRFYRDYLEHVGLDSRGPLTFLEDSYTDGVERVRDALRAAGLVVEKQQNLSDNYDVSTTQGFSNYEGRYARRIRVLYAFLIEAKLRTDPANPAEVVDWHKMNDAQRAIVANATITNPFGRKYAGMRFVVKGRQRHLGRPQNPEGVADEMNEAVLESEAPPVIKILNQVYRDEAPRVFELLPATGLGWGLAGFGDTLLVANKFGTGRPEKPLALAGHVQEWLVANFASQPHPDVAGRTLMDHMRELLAAGAFDELESIELFVSPKTGKSYSRSGLRYWIQDAMLAGEVKAGEWTPSPHFYRNCRMHKTVTAIFAETEPGLERSRRLAKAGEEFGHESAAWRTYVRFAWEEESRRIRREEAEERKRAWEAKKAGVAHVRRSTQLADPVADRLHAALPSRARS